MQLIQLLLINENIHSFSDVSSLLRSSYDHIFSSATGDAVTNWGTWMSIQEDTKVQLSDNTMICAVQRQNLRVI